VTPAFEVQTRGINGLTGNVFRADPAAGKIIKDEPKTVVWRQTLPDGTPAVLKVYLYRTFMRIKQLGWCTSRSEREFRAMYLSEQHHVPCSSPLFWAMGRNDSGVTYELLATREITGATDLKAWLIENRDKHALDLKPLFTLIASLHRAGIQHGALLARNILYARNEFHLIDYPRSHIYGKSIEGRHAGCFDLKLLLQNLTRYVPDLVLVDGLAGYPKLPGSAEHFLQTYKSKRFNKLQRPLIRAVHALHSRCSRLFRVA